MASEQQERAFNKFLDLPTELVEWIALHLNQAELLELRLTCRELCSKTFLVFSKYCFEDRCFIFSHPESMKTLLAVSELPVFSKRLKRIRFSLAEMTSDREDFCSRPYGKSRARRVEIREQRRTFHQLQRQEESYRQGQDEIDVLQIFRNLAASNLSPDIIATDTELQYAHDAYMRPWRLNCMRRKLGHPDCMCEDLYYSNLPLEKLYKALADSRYPVRWLELGNLMQSLPLSCMMDHTINTSRLRALKLSLFSTAHPLYVGDPDYHRSQYRRNLTGLLRVLIESPDLRLLDLKLDRWLAKRGFFDAFSAGLHILDTVLEGTEFKFKGAVDLPDLRVFRLDGFQVDPTIFQIFVGSRSATLSIVELTNVPKWDPEFDVARERIQRWLGAGRTPGFIEVNISSEWTREEDQRRWVEED